MIPPVLRPQTGGDAEVAAAGATVGDVLGRVAEAHPGHALQLFADGGELNRYVNVYLNDEDVRVLDGLETPVSDSDTVVILPAMAGGRRSPATQPPVTVDLGALVRFEPAGWTLPARSAALTLSVWAPRRSFGSGSAGSRASKRLEAIRHRKAGALGGLEDEDRRRSVPPSTCRCLDPVRRRHPDTSGSPARRLPYHLRRPSRTARRVADRRRGFEVSRACSARTGRVAWRRHRRPTCSEARVGRGRRRWPGRLIFGPAVSTVNVEPRSVRAVDRRTLKAAVRKARRPGEREQGEVPPSGTRRWPVEEN